MLKYFKVAILFLALTSIFIDVSAQQNVFSRDVVTTGNWGDGQLPWYYQTSNNNQGDPDNNGNTANFIRFGHNNNLTMDLNGRSYRAREIIFEAAATSSRTIGGNNLEMRPNNGNCKIENFSIANHVFNNNIALFAPTQINPVNGDLTINGDIITNNNFVDIFGDNGNTLTIIGVIDGTNGIGLQQNSTVVLNGLNSYGGGTFINAGKIIVNTNNSLGSISGSTTVAAGGILEIDGADQLSEPVFLNGTGQSNSGALRKVNSGTDQFSGAIGLQSDSRIHIDQGNFDYLGTMSLNGFTFYLGGDGNFNFESSSSLLGATKTSLDGAIFKDGTGLLEFRPDPSITGNLHFLNGEVRQFTGNYATSGLLILSGGVVYRSDGSTNRDVAKPTRIDGNVTLGFGVGANSEIDFLTSVDFSGGNHTLTMTNDNFISGQMTNGSFTKAGTGSLTIQGTAANTLSNGSVVSEGTLILAKNAGLQATAGLTINAGATVRTDNDNQWGTVAPPFIQIPGGTLNINGTTQRLALEGNASSSVQLGSGTLIIDGTGTDTFAGVISGSGGVTKEGSGTEIFSGSNTYSGSTTITEGTLQLGAFNTLPPTSQIILNGGTLRSTNAVISSSLGTIELAESSTLDLSGNAEGLNFLNSSGIAWNTDATLTILGWTGSAEQPGASSKIFFPNASALTEDQLLRIQFDGPYDFGATFVNSGAVVELVPKVQNIVRFDDFNRPASGTLGNTSSGLGGTWNDTEILSPCLSSGDFVRINSSGQLVLSNEDGTCSSDDGEKFTAIDVSGLYATRFEEADSLMEWYFNMQQNESNPSLQNRTAFIIGSTSADFTNGSGAQGYAVAIGETGSTDELHLIYFDDGLPNTTSFGESIISQSLTSRDDHLSIKVTFDPCSDQWTLTVREDGTSFKDAASISGVGGTAINTTHVDKDLFYIGAYRDHTSSGTKFSLFDNIYIPKVLPSSNTYVWDGSSDTDYQNPDNWTPRRICSKPTDIVNFSLTANETVTNVPSEILAQLNISGAYELILSDEAGDLNPSLIAIRNGNLNLDVLSTLILDVATSNSPPTTPNDGDGIQIELVGSSTADFNGNVVIRNSNTGTAARRHRIFANAAGAIQVNGTIRIEDLNGSLFDGGTANSVEFNSGSIYECFDGANPFGLTAPSSRVVFETGSTYRYLSNAASLSINGRSYSNFEFNAGSTETLTFGSANAFDVDSLLILSGTFNIVPTGPSYDVLVSGNLRVDNTATFNFDPADEVRLTLDGSQGQRIYGTGTINLGENVIFSIDNSAVGNTVELEKDLTVFNDFELLDGELQGNGSDLVMEGVDHVLLVNGELEGEIIGANDEIDLLINANTALNGSGSVCNFLNVTVANGVDFRLNRGLQVIRGVFLINENARLIIGNGGFIETTDPQYVRPTYNNNSFLIYDSGLTGPLAYGRGVEWGTSTGPGFPHHVSVVGTTNLNPGANSNTNTVLSMAGDLFIEAGSGFFLDFSGNNMTVPLIIDGSLQLEGGLSGFGSSGADIQLKGDWSQAGSGSFFPNGCEVLFNGAATQNFSSANSVTFDDVAIDNSAGLLINTDLTLSGNFDFISGIVEPASAEKLIFEDNATASNPSNASHYQGIVVKEGDDNFTFPVGDFYIDPVPPGLETGNYYQPIGISGLDGNSTFEAQYFAEAHPESGSFYDGNANASPDGFLEEIGNCDFWSLNRTVGTESAIVTLTYGNTPCNDIQPGGSDFLQIAKWDGSFWEYPILEGANPLVAGELSSISEISTFSDFVLASNRPDFNVLPITLLAFHAEVKDGLVHTNWVTASEINNDFFTVERSKDGNSWEEVGTVDGAGNSNTELAYAFVDDDPYSGISYYRLRQTDFDGTTTVSEIRAVEILQGSAFGLDKVYRGQDGLNLVYRSTAPYVVVEIYDLLGKRIHGELLENYGNGFATIHPDLARGAYVLRLSHGSEMDAEKFVW